jgi:hypothetical protein
VVDLEVVVEEVGRIKKPPVRQLAEAVFLFVTAKQAVFSDKVKKD